MTDARTFVLKSEDQCRRAAYWLSKLACDEEHPLEVIVRPYRKRRSTAQNARYWAILQHISQRTGYSVNELHEYCKVEFIGADRYELQGRVIEVPRSTKDLNTADFADYCNRVEEWAARTFGVSFGPDY